jgi:broad specificity phosphatase PhoE
VIFLTHAEVEIDPAVPVPDWGLSSTGRARHAAFAASAEADGISAVFASTERKAREGAAPVADRLGIELRHRAALGENDRSATGYLPKAEFEATADRFFAEPDASIRGWESARAAQTRIVGAVRDALEEPRPEGDVLIVAHGGVGTLLRCHLLGQGISRSEDLPHPGGGCWFAFPASIDAAPTPWSAI